MVIPDLIRCVGIVIAVIAFVLMIIMAPTAKYHGPRPGGSRRKHDE